MPIDPRPIHKRRRQVLNIAPTDPREIAKWLGQLSLLDQSLVWLDVVVTTWKIPEELFRTLDQVRRNVRTLVESNPPTREQEIRAMVKKFDRWRTERRERTEPRRTQEPCSLRPS